MAVLCCVEVHRTRAVVLLYPQLRTNCRVKKNEQMPISGIIPRGNRELVEV